MALLGVGFALVGCFLLYFASRTNKRAARSLSWPKIPGTITHSDVIETKQQSGEYGTNTYTVYEAKVGYTYEVAGQTYTGQRIRAGGTEIGSSAAAQKFRDLYPLGRAVDVAYDPVQPQSAMLEPGNAAGVLKLRIMGVVFVVAGSSVAASALYS